MYARFLPSSGALSWVLFGLAASISITSGARAQSSAGFPSGSTPTADQLNAAFQLKEDYIDAPRSVRSFGAKCDGVTDDAAAFTAALNSGYPLVDVPAGANCRLASGIVVPDGVTLKGLTFTGHSNGLAGSQVTCDLMVPRCVTLGNNDNGSPSLKTLTVTRAAGTPPSGSIGIYVSGSSAVILDSVMSFGHAIGYYFKAEGPSGAGITAHVARLYSGKISDAHVVVDTWPELYVSQSRFGVNGAFDVNANTFVRFTGGDPTAGGAGPNTVFFSQVQFNQGSAPVAHWLEFVNLNGTVPTSNASEFKFSDVHVENVSGGIFTDASWNILNRLKISGLSYNQGAGPFFQLNAATQPSEWEISDSEIFAGSIRLAPTSGVINAVNIANSRLNGASSFVGGPGATMNLTGNSYGGNLVLTGAWGALNLTGGAFTTGSLTNNATGLVSVLLPEQLGFKNCAVGLAVNGSTAGITYQSGFPSCRYSVVGGVVNVQVAIQLTSKGSNTGEVSLTGLPVPVNGGVFANGGGGLVTFFNNTVSLPGPVVVNAIGGTSAAALFVPGSGGAPDRVNASNLTNTSQFFLNLQYLM